MLWGGREDKSPHTQNISFLICNNKDCLIQFNIASSNNLICKLMKMFYENVQKQQYLLTLTLTDFTPGLNPGLTLSYCTIEAYFVNSVETLI